MSEGMELWRPNWHYVMKGCVFNNANANELVSVTNETARLALSAIEARMSSEYYHNDGAAAAELRRVLVGRG